MTEHQGELPELVQIWDRPCVLLPSAPVPKTILGRQKRTLPSPRFLKKFGRVHKATAERETYVLPKATESFVKLHYRSAGAWKDVAAGSSRGRGLDGKKVGEDVNSAGAPVQPLAQKDRAREQDKSSGLEGGQSRTVVDPVVRPAPLDQKGGRENDQPDALTGE